MAPDATRAKRRLFKVFDYRRRKASVSQRKVRVVVPDPRDVPKEKANGT